MIRFCALLAVLASPIAAETVVAARTIPAQSLIQSEDVAFINQEVPGGISDAAALIGMEARVALYAGRPIRSGDVALPAVVERNQIIRLYFESNGLVIITEGRALGRAGPGDLLSVMNMSSRTTVSARIGEDGAGYVQQ